MSKIYRFWNDAKLVAKEDSWQQGFAWVTEAPVNENNKISGFQVSAGASTEDAPFEFNAEFKDGIEQ